MAKKKPALLLKTRRYKDCEFGSAWLIRRDQAAYGSLLFGEVRLKTLEWLEEQAAAIGLPVEKEEPPWSPAAPVQAAREKTPVSGDEASLFDALWEAANEPC